MRQIRSDHRTHPAFIKFYPLSRVKLDRVVENRTHPAFIKFYPLSRVKLDRVVESVWQPAQAGGG